MFSRQRTACAVALLTGFLISGCATGYSGSAPERIDILVQGGTVYDGTEAPGRIASVAIDEGRIVYLGDDVPRQYFPERVVDAAGLVVAPGFIDPHTHADADLRSPDKARRANLPFAFQGITTVVVGNDGFGSPDIAAMAHSAARDGIGTNVAYLVGFGPVREAVLAKSDRDPTVVEQESIRAAVRQAMCEGAWGFSSGLYYVPQNFGSTAEVVALARVAAEFGGYYDTHMRDESTYNVGLEGALTEAIEIARQARLPLHIAHIKALGPAVWGHSAKMIAMIEKAQGEGMRITADQYPWEASGTRISNALVPRWALEGGLAELRKRLGDPNVADRIHQEMSQAMARRGGADKLLITAPLGDAKVEPGQTLSDLGESMGVDPVEAALQVLLEGDARLASFNMSETDIRAFAYQDWVVTGSDGSTGHPRKYASFPKAYRDLVVEGDMALSRFIRRSSGQTADIVGLSDRGYLKPGFAADIVILDPDRFSPQATYQSPRELSDGVRYLLVNGEILIDRGKHTGALPGQPLLKPSVCPRVPRAVN